MQVYPPTLVIDRIEGEYAICEAPDKTLVLLPLNQLPAEIAPGDVLRLMRDHYQIDPDETAKRREQNYELFRSIFHKP